MIDEEYDEMKMKVIVKEEKEIFIEAIKNSKINAITDQETSKHTDTLVIPKKGLKSMLMRFLSRF